MTPNADGMPLLRGYCTLRVACRGAEADRAQRAVYAALATEIRREARGIEALAIVQADALLRAPFQIAADALERRALNDVLWEPSS